MNGVRKKIEILAELYFNYNGEPNFAEFFFYNSIGLPLAYVVNEELATLTLIGENYINETYGILIASLGADQEAEYESLADLLNQFSL